jgi:hypothetical protein
MYPVFRRQCPGAGHGGAPCSALACSSSASVSALAGVRQQHAPPAVLLDARHAERGAPLCRHRSSPHTQRPPVLLLTIAPDQVLRTLWSAAVPMRSQHIIALLAAGLQVLKVFNPRPKPLPTSPAPPPSPSPAAALCSRASSIPEDPQPVRASTPHCISRCVPAMAHAGPCLPVSRRIA